MAASGAAEMAGESESGEQRLLAEIEELKRNLQRTYGDSSLVKAAIDSSISNWNLDMVRQCWRLSWQVPHPLVRQRGFCIQERALLNNHNR